VDRSPPRPHVPPPSNPIECRAQSPTNSEVHERLQRVAHRHPDLVTLRTVGSTAQGRQIPAATIFDPGADPEDLQHVLIAAGQHGNEETARLVALRLIDFLLSADGRPILRRQKIVVMPNISPDAAEADSYETPAGIKPNLDHPPSGASSPEGKALETVAAELAPELYVDIHARGHAGCSHDMVLFPPTRPYTEDEHLLHLIAAEMADAGSRSGIPHVVHPLTWPGWGGFDLDQPSSTLQLYRRYKSMVFLTESAEHNEIAYPIKQRETAGVNRLKPLLDLGCRRYIGCYYSGYPVNCAVGMFHCGVVAVGKTAGARRRSRVELWQNAAAFEKLMPKLPEPPHAKTVQVEYRGPPLAGGAGFQVRVAGKLHVQRVAINGKALRPSETTGYYTWQDRYTTYAVAVCPKLMPGTYEIDFRFH
jgi:hypothetical protein